MPPAPYHKCWPGQRGHTIRGSPGLPTSVGQEVVYGLGPSDSSLSLMNQRLAAGGYRGCRKTRGQHRQVTGVDPSPSSQGRMSMMCRVWHRHFGTRWAFKTKQTPESCVRRCSEGPASPCSPTLPEVTLLLGCRAHLPCLSSLSQTSQHSRKQPLGLWRAPQGPERRAGPREASGLQPGS